MKDLKTQLVYGWIDYNWGVIHPDDRKYGIHKRQLILGTTHTRDNIPQNIVYGVPVKIIDNRLLVDALTVRDINEKAEKWSESTGRDYVTPDYYTIITGGLDWAETSEYYL
jgi:hypothetical protein